MIDDVHLYRARLIDSREAHLRPGLAVVGDRATEHASLLLPLSASISDSYVAEHLESSVIALNAYCEQLTDAAIMYTGASDRPDTSEAASLTAKHRAWQQYTALLVRLADDMQRSATIVNSYIAGRRLPPVEGARAGRTRGIAQMRAWARHGG